MDLSCHSVAGVEARWPDQSPVRVLLVSLDAPHDLVDFPAIDANVVEQVSVDAPQMPNCLAFPAPLPVFQPGVQQQAA